MVKIDLSCLNYSHSRGRNGSLPGIFLKGIDINYKSLLVLIKIISNNFLSRYPNIFFFGFVEFSWQINKKWASYFQRAGKGGIRTALNTEEPMQNAELLIDFKTIHDVLVVSMFLPGTTMRILDKWRLPDIKRRLPVIDSSNSSSLSWTVSDSRRETSIVIL